jgi:hypothetical protein
MEQSKIDQLWSLKKEMVQLHNEGADAEKLLNHINDNLDPEDEQYLSMAIDCMTLTEQMCARHQELYNSIYNKYVGKQFDSMRTAFRVALLEMLIENK